MITQLQPKAECAILVWTGRERSQADEALLELRALAQAVEIEVGGVCVQVLTKPVAATYIGKGKLEELREMLNATNSELVICDHSLSPAQRRNLEVSLDVKVIDRSQLILDIFAARAMTRAGKIQVELAQLEYLLPRLTRQWTHLSRIRGGVGMRGPGETQLESDRRQLRTRIGVLRRKLAAVDRTRRLNRKGRGSVPVPEVALVGYTNAGKSSILNALTGGDAFVADQLFATLDTTSHRLRLGDGSEIIVSDTVGFIANLPHELIEAFKGTLEQAAEADLLLHVVDSSRHDIDERIEVVRSILRELGADDRRSFLVYNKSDLSGAVSTPKEAVGVSAVDGTGIEELMARITHELNVGDQNLEVTLPASDGRTLAWLHQNAKVLERVVGKDGEANHNQMLRVSLLVSGKVAGRLRSLLDAEGYPIRTLRPNNQC